MPSASHGVICDWGTGALLPESTRQFREQMKIRSVPHWSLNAARYRRYPPEGEEPDEQAHVN